MDSKKTLFSAVLLLGTIFVFSCASKKDDSHEHHGSDDENVWEEMDRFHMIMAESFHPFRDSSNLDPAKARAGALMKAANEWAAASLPDKVDNADVRSKLGKLKSEAATLAESVKSSDDNVIGEQLTRLHHTFHEIEEAWYGGH